MDVLGIFRDFGYPALVTGVFVWLYVTQLEKLIVKVDALKDKIGSQTDAITALTTQINELRNDVKEWKR